MVNPKRFYTYAYLREDRTPYYIGKGEGNRAYRKRKDGINPPKDELRIIFLKQNLTEQEAFRHEIYMISVFGRKDLETGILRNRTNGGEGVSGLIVSEETRKKCRKTGSKNGKKQYEQKIGLFSITAEELEKYCSMGGKKASELGLGIHSLTTEQRSENGKIGGRIAGRKNYENKTACFSITPEQRIEINKKTNSQRWMCLETGYITTAGPLTMHQKARGIDPSKRKRIK